MIFFKIFEMVKQIFNLKFLLLITAISLVIISINYTSQTIKNRKIENIASLEKMKKIKILDSISKLKIWDTLDLSNVGIDTIFLETKYVNSKLYYKLELFFNSKNKNIYNVANSLNEFRIAFRDTDDFNIYTIILDISNKIGIIDDANNIVGINFEGHREIDKDIYIKLDSYSIQYKGD